jgi:hypothetical protein
MNNPDFPLWESLNTSFRNETELAQWAYQQLDPFFIIHREIRGTHCTGRRLRIDAIL